MAITVNDSRTSMQAEANGYFSAHVPDARAGDTYFFAIDDDRTPLPDPASRFQPEGPHGPSEIIDASQFEWTDQDWRGVSRDGQVIYEMHIGTFTREGTWIAAAKQLHHLADLGVTLLEIMPIADFAGRFGWGYDGVNMFAPTRLYGRPDDFRHFVNKAHSFGLGVILDVVYNHLGPDGNYLRHFSKHYFTSAYDNEWGDAINFDGEHSEPVREFFITNAGYWIEEFHLDGLRLDATQQIFDRSNENILRAVTRRAREAAGGRSIFVVAENEPQDAKLVRSLASGGYGIDAIWNDDFHHTAMVAMTGRNEAYYTDYLGTPQEIISAAKWGTLYQGQRYKWQKQRRGTPALDLAPANFVTFIQNHDQVANSAYGLRCHRLTSPGRYRALTALLLLMPSTPMLFQGQEFASSSPFKFFADHQPELAEAVRRGRRQFLSQFPSLALEEIQALLSDPSDPTVFESCKLDFHERERNADVYRLHKDLLNLRRDDPTLRRREKQGIDGAVLGEQAFVLRFFGANGDDRLLFVNLGIDCHLDPAPEPLLAPPANMAWELLWSSEDPRYSGSGTPALETEENWRIPGEAAVVMKPLYLQSG